MIHRVSPPKRVHLRSVVCLILLAGVRVQGGDEFLPPLPPGQHWELAWSDEFDGTALDQSKWDVMGDWKRRDGFWVKEDAYLDERGARHWVLARQEHLHLVR